MSGRKDARRRIATTLGVAALAVAGYGVGVALSIARTGDLPFLAATKRATATEAAGREVVLKIAYPDGIFDQAEASVVTASLTTGAALAAEPAAPPQIEDSISVSTSDGITMSLEPRPSPHRSDETAAPRAPQPNAASAADLVFWTPRANGASDSGTKASGPTAAQVLFPSGGYTLPADATGALDALAAELANSNERIELMAYATATRDTVNEARRIALKRAIAVRTYLADRGIPQTRVDIRAMGVAEAGEAERVDVVRPSS